MDLADLVDPAHTALCVVECQNGVVGPASSIPAVAAAVADADLLARPATLAARARRLCIWRTPSAHTCMTVLTHNMSPACITTGGGGGKCTPLRKYSSPR